MSTLKLVNLIATLFNSYLYISIKTLIFYTLTFFDPLSVPVCITFDFEHFIFNNSGILDGDLESSGLPTLSTYVYIIYLIYVCGIDNHDRVLMTNIFIIISELQQMFLLHLSAKLSEQINKVI